MSHTLPTVTLSNGMQLPAIGLGTYKSTGNQAVNNTVAALQSGYRLIDTATLYKNEAEIGEAIRQSGVPRDEIKVTTKLWRSDLGYEQAKKAFDLSIDLLGLEYIDLYLIHWPAHAGMTADWQEVNAGTWRALEEIYDSGRAKAIGVSNFLVHHLSALLQRSIIKPVINQIEFHPGYMQLEILELCRAENIQLEAWSPLGRGEIFDDPIIMKLSEKHAKTAAQIALRWAVQHQVIPIPKASSIKRLEENISIFDFSLTEAEMQQINDLPQMAFSGHHPDRW